MRAAAAIAFLLFLVAVGQTDAQEIDGEIITEDRTARGDAMKRYFLIRHRLEPAELPPEHALLLILPGGPGSADFLPFCANVLTRHGTPKDFIVAQLVAPVWKKTESEKNVWPSTIVQSRAAKFRTEEFISAVIEEVSREHRIRDGWIFLLGWSSSGHAVYSSSFENPKIGGAFIAMSRFIPRLFTQLRNAKGKRYYLWHSPQDSVCPYSDAETAAKLLTQSGALTILKSYNGGHGWVPNSQYVDRINEALTWFRAPVSDAKTMQAKIAADKPATR